MRRWNGWGDEGVETVLGGPALAFLRERIGQGIVPADASFEQACAALPASRLAPHPLLALDAPTRLRNALGQSLPDWLRLRYGRIDAAPDGVAFPDSAAQVRQLLALARERGLAVITRGGGTSVAGHVGVAPGGNGGNRDNGDGMDRPTLVLNLQRLCGLIDFDAESQLATFGAGILGPDLEAQLRARGHTLGHFPQSFEYSSLGGWIATRSSGQQSLRYGRIEQLFAGATLETPAGTLRITPFPASAAGTDLREMVLGSEGRLGIVTQATVRVRPLPDYEAFHAVFFPDWEAGREAVRALSQARPGLSMLRLSNALETQTMLALAGDTHPRLVGVLSAYLSLRGCNKGGGGRCMLLLGVSGERRETAAALRAALRLCRGGVHIGRALGDRWRRGRFKNVYLRNAAWRHGYAIDTVETAVNWPQVTPMMRAIERSAVASFAVQRERVHAYTHLSHVYPQGASVYSTFIYRLSGDFDEDLRRWSQLKAGVSRAIVDHGGTISHQHGVGVDHARYLEAEKGALGLGAMAALFRHADPEGIMNPGKLLPAGGDR
jgi:alkyldihydroxyacetonephosphate synthase